MSLGRLSPADYTIRQIRGKEGFINGLEGIRWYKVSERLLLTNTQCVSLELLRWNPSGNWVVQFQWTKTLYQNILNNTASFFTFFKAYRYNLYYHLLCNNTEDYNFSWEPKKINVKFHKNCENTVKILKISCVRCHFVKFDIRFLGLP